MKRGYRKLLIICLILIILLLINIAFNILDKNNYILFLFATFLGLLFLLGFEKDKYLYRRDIITTIIISCIFYLIITYSAGLFIGFVKNGYNLDFISIIKNIIPFFTIICFEELIRYSLVKKGSRNISVMILATIILILMDMTLVIKGFDLNNGYLMIEFLLSHFLPVIFKNIFLTYIVYKGGYKTSLIYRSFMELHLYLMPILPKLGIYMGSILKIIFPSLILLIIYKITKANDSKNFIGNYKYKNKWTIMLIFLMLVMIGINCGWFKYYSLTVGSDSMTPNINKGDIIVIEKMRPNDLSRLKIGDVLIFDKGDKILVHRIVDIQKIGGQYQFYTKGDANEDVDHWITEEKDVIGTIKFRMLYVGWPTVWLSEFIEK